MSGLDYRTAGESHGPALTALVEGMPAGVSVDIAFINHEMRRRQGGYGRSGRMRMEQDEVTVLSGVRGGLTTGSPLTLQIANRDARLESAPPVHRPRPGHADLAGALKWRTPNFRNVIERASARETAARVAAGALAKCLLREFNVEVMGFVVAIAGAEAAIGAEASWESLMAARDQNEVYCPDADAGARMVEEVRRAMEAGDTVGGVVEVRVRGCPPGLGSCMRWQDKLDGRLMQAVGSVQAIKGVEIGLGFAAARRRGSDVHDPVGFDPAAQSAASLGFVRSRNNAGGVEGGMTNGSILVLRAAMKPISTLAQGMESVDLRTLRPQHCDYERSDVCAVPAASVVVDNVVAFEIARAFLEKFGGDTLDEVRASYDNYRDSIRRWGDTGGTEA